MHAQVRFALVCGSLLATSCFVPSNASPDVELGLAVQSKHVHRGMTQVDAPVLKPSGAVGLPTTWGGKVSLATEAYMDLENDTGDAWFPDGHAGRFSQIDYIGDYSHTFFPIRRDNADADSAVGDLTVSLGTHNYNLPNGLEFVNGERGSTSEAFVQLSLSVLDATPYVRWSYDYDEVEGSYATGGLTEGFELGGDFTLRLDGSLSYSSDTMSAWNYAISESGLADLRGSVELDYAYDARTVLTAGVHGSMMVDDTFQDWFDDLGIDPEVLWFTVGVTWVFGGKRS